MQLKRLWDITNKKMVFVKGPTGHECQLWVDEATDKMYYYDMAQWLEYTQSAVNDGKTYGPTWKVVDSDDEMGVYDTNEPTELFNWESGDQVSYVFKDWDGTVLKEGKVKEGTKPTAPADPTREATAQYTYTFAGWNPEVAKITKKTTYTATYTSTVNEYLITFVDEDGTTELDEQTLEYGETPVYAGETPTKEATAQYTYTFSGWTPTIATVTADATYTATYDATVNTYTVSISSNEPEAGSVDVTSIPNVPYGTSITYSDNTMTVGNTTVTATAESGFVFDFWGLDTATVTENISQVAYFTTEPSPSDPASIILNVSSTSSGKLISNDQGQAVTTPYTINGNTECYWTTSSNTINIDGGPESGLNDIYTATAEEGYTFVEWQIDNVGVGDNTAAFEDGTEIVAVFESNL